MLVVLFGVLGFVGCFFWLFWFVKHEFLGSCRAVRQWPYKLPYRVPSLFFLVYYLVCYYLDSTGVCGLC